MILSFSQRWPASMGKWAGQPNYFIEKIWSSLQYAGDREWTCLHNNYMTYHRIQFGHDWDNEFPSIARGHSPKLHTLREDPHNRWKPGMLIHPVINNRSKDQFQFAPTFNCTGIQYVKIIHGLNGRLVSIGNRRDYEDCVPIYFENDHDGDVYGLKEMQVLAQNDGFESVDQFFAWFNKDWKGKIIHWAEIRY